MIRYSTETLSYATLVAGVRYQVEPPPQVEPAGFLIETACIVTAYEPLLAPPFSLRLD